MEWQVGRKKGDREDSGTVETYCIKGDGCLLGKWCSGVVCRCIWSFRQDGSVLD